MNIAAIQTFLAVHRLGHLNRAAEELNVTQSAVTARLDALEQALSTRLLNRSRKGATLTKSGYAFLEQAAVIARTWQTAQARSTLPDGVTSLLSIVCDPALWAGLGRELVTQWRAAHPEVAFDIWTARYDEATDWLATGLSDIAIQPTALTHADLSHSALPPEELIQVATTARSKMAWDPGYVYVDHGHAFRQWHTETWPGDEMARIRFSNPEWALQHLLDQGGSAYLPEPLVSPYLRQGQLHRVHDAASFTRTSVLSWHRRAVVQFPWIENQTP